MTYTKSTDDQHPFAHTTRVWFKGGHHAVANPEFAGFKVGDEVHIRQWLEETEDGLTTYYVRLLEDSEPDDGENAPVWNVSWFTDCQSKIIRNTPTDVQEDEMTENTSTPRPTVRFDDRDVNRSTARAYANDLISRVNKPETNDVLSVVADGGEVDAYLLAEALLDASRHVATRFGQSMARRRAGEKVAHLGYIAHAVLQNHADGLPAYEGGARSRAVEESKRALVLAREEVDAVTKALESRKREVLEAKAAHATYREQADAEVSRLLEIIEQQKQELSVVKIERDAAAAVIGYVVERLDGEDRAGILGYWEGVKDATLPSREG